MTRRRSADGSGVAPSLLEDRIAEAAKTFAQRHHASVPVDGPPARRLEGLCRVLDAWLDGSDGDGGGPADDRPQEPPEERERRFIEGAGALLAAILAEHLGPDSVRPLPGGDGTVRLGLGRAGAFDPFAAIDGVLDDPRPVRRSLAEAVRRAEDEAAGRGSIARTALAFETLLQRDRPGRRVAVFAGTHLELDDGTEVDLGRVLQATEGRPEDARWAAVGRVVAALPSSRGRQRAPDEPPPAVDPWPAVERDLVPRLVGPAFLRELGPRADELYRQPFRKELGLEVAFLVQAAGRGRFVLRREVADWGVDDGVLRSTAISNLRARSARVHLRREPLVPAEAPIVVARSGDALDTARLLLPDFRQGLGDALGGTDHLWVALPHRDVVLAASGTAPATVLRALATRVRSDHDTAPHPITPEVFRVSLSPR
ncbi:MAG TPA: hypothetical protein RMF84_08950 [Polyangiaceae bacterium LLY-WYZ-14_1]|nr:hypothetical protein [Polyangiaceae bacterium LLY-WYZ-14_1]